MNSTKDQQAAFEEVGRLVGELFIDAIKHAASASPEAAGWLASRFRADRGSVRAVVGLGAPGAVDFEWRDDRGEWRPVITLRGETPPEMRPN